MDIANPRRILAVSSTDATQHLSRVIKDLTGAHPEPTGPSLAGTTHNLALKTAYYAAEVPIWLDLVASPSEWAASFLSPEAKEVLEVLGGIVVVFALPTPALGPSSPLQQPPPPPLPSGDGAAAAGAGAAATAAKELIREVGRVVREGLGGWEWDGVGLCVGVGEADDVDEWEDCCAEWGLEFVQVRGQQNAAKRNEFGEKMGIPRVLEALESNDWTPAPGVSGDDDLDSEFGGFEGELIGGADDSKDQSSSSARKLESGDGRDDDGLDLDPESLDFGFDREDFAGLRRAIWSASQDNNDDDGFMNKEPSSSSSSRRGATGGGEPGGSGDGNENGNAGGDGGGGEESLDEDEVRKLEQMMAKLQAVRDMSAGLPEDQRKRMAARAVSEVMKDL